MEISHFAYEQVNNTYATTELLQREVLDLHSHRLLKYTLHYTYGWI